MLDQPDARIRTYFYEGGGFPGVLKGERRGIAFRDQNIGRLSPLGYGGSGTVREGGWRLGRTQAR